LTSIPIEVKGWNDSGISSIASQSTTYDLSEGRDLEIREG